MTRRDYSATTWVYLSGSGSVLLRRLETELLGDRRELPALLLDRRGEFLRRAWNDELAGGGRARGDGRLAEHGPDVGGDALAHGLRQLLATKQADEPVEREIRGTGLRHGRDVGILGRALAVDDRDQPDPAGL